MKRPRQRAEAHLEFIRSLPCLICFRQDTIDAAHIRMGERGMGKRPTGMGEKASDCWTLPMCREHHELQHRGSERRFWESWKINPFAKALALWVATGDRELGEQIVREP